MFGMLANMGDLGESVKKFETMVKNMVDLLERVDANQKELNDKFDALNAKIEEMKNGH